MQTRFEWLAKQSIYKHLRYFSIHTLSSCHSEFELDTTAAVRSKHKCILQLPPPTKNARQNLPIFHPHLLPCCSQLVFSVKTENQRKPEVLFLSHCCWDMGAVRSTHCTKFILKMLLHPSHSNICHYHNCHHYYRSLQKSFGSYLLHLND